MKIRNKDLRTWLNKRSEEVLKLWKNNEISQADAASKLYHLGIPAQRAWKILEET